MNASQLYSRDLRDLTVLPPDEQHELACRFARERDPRDARRLLLANLKLVLTIARSLGARRSDFMDLVQEGNAGLMVAIERFDPAYGTKLSTYAALWIRAYIIRFLMDTSSLVRSTTTRAGRKQFFARTLPADVRLDSPLGSAGDEGPTACGLDRLPGSEDLRPDALVEAHEELLHFREVVATFCSTLTAREREIFKSRLLEETPRPLRKLGATLDLSGERVRQLEQRLFLRLRSLVNDSMEVPHAVAA